MTKGEMHYLNCTDTNCEEVACVARREYEQKISNLKDDLKVMNELTKNISVCPRCDTCRESAKTILKINGAASLEDKLGD